MNLRNNDMKDEIKNRLAQIQAGKIPEGYKKDKLGIIPQEWEIKPLKSRFDRLTRKNSEGNTNVMTISAQYGLINQEEFFKKEIASEDKSNYYLMYCGEFAYNKSYSNGYPFGAIKRLSLYDKGVVSPLYICFSANKDNPCPEFYQHYFEGGKLNSEIHAIAQEGARNHGLLNISVEDFFYTHIIVPHIEEQKKIADILSAQDKIIELCERKIEQLKRMKKYYLQNMFPKDGEEYPKIRFKGFTYAWKQQKLRDISDTYSGGTPTADKAEYYGGNIPFIRSAEVNSDSTELFLTEEGLKNSSAKMVKQGDILYALYGATSGEVGLARLNGAINQAILDIKPHMNYDTQFIMQWLRKSKENIIATYLQGGQGNLSGTIVTSLAIDCPNYIEQQRIGDYFRNLDHLITLHQRKCEEEKKKKKALQQLLLTGISRINYE